MKKIYTINTINNFLDIIFNPFGKEFFAGKDDVEVYNIMDDSLLVDTRKYGEMTPVIASRVLNYAKAAQASGADAVIVTCTSINQATKAIEPFLDIPIINIEEPVAEIAVKTGTKIGIIGTIPTSPLAMEHVVLDKAKLANKDVKISKHVVEGAYEILMDGDRKKHDEMVNEKILEVAKQVDVIVFSQISMSQIEDVKTETPLFKIGTSGFEKIYELVK